jgi:hypothetical protein
MTDSGETWHLPIRPIDPPADVAAALAEPAPMALATPPDNPPPATRAEIDAFVARNINARPLPDLWRRP